MCHVEECKFQLGSFQYRGDQLRFVLADLVQDEERRNVLLDHLTLTQLQAYTEYLEKAPNFSHPTLKNLLPPEISEYCKNLDIDVCHSLENSSRYVMCWACWCC